MLEPRSGQGASEKGQDRIIVALHVLTGKPVIKGSRLAVEFIIDLLAHG